MPRIFRAKAPLRIGIAGGGTDVEPYASEHGGLVFNTTIDKYAYCTLIPNDSDEMTVMSPEYGTVCERIELPMEFKGDCNDLVRAVVNHFNVTEGFKVFVKSDVPPGSGLGGSSTLMVAIIKAFSEWKKVRLDRNELAELAYHLEREDVGLGGGRQDQYAAAFGGFNMMHFGSGGTVVKPLRLKDSLVEELQERSLLCFTGKSRDSAAIIEQQVKELRKDDSKEDVYDETKRLAGCIGKAMRLGDLDGAAALLNLAWEQKKKFSSKVSNGIIDEFYRTAMDNGAIGGKVSGAGGGGFMFFICAPGKREKVAGKLAALGADIMEFRFESKGASIIKSGVGDYASRFVGGWFGSSLSPRSD